MKIVEQLRNVQFELKAPKGQRNTFGKYNYRSCEDILEAVKPLLDKEKITLCLDDSIEIIGNRFYVKATATLQNEDGESIQNHAFAREAETKKGMDDSQITGTASSYARKYALNGLFLIDDTKDADTDEYHNQTGKSEKPQAAPPAPKLITSKQVEELLSLCSKAGWQPAGMLKYLQEKYPNAAPKKLEEITYPEYSSLATMLNNRIKKAANGA